MVSVLQQTIENAYLDGYKAACEEMKSSISESNQPNSINIDGVRFVDMGLPSGTLWSDGPLKKDSSIFRYEEFIFNDAVKYSIPTVEQWDELSRRCVFRKENGNLVILASNGNRIIVFPIESKFSKEKVKPRYVAFWLNQSFELLNKARAVSTKDINKIEDGCTVSFATGNLFIGESLPIFLVKSPD